MLRRATDAALAESDPASRRQYDVDQRHLRQFLKNFSRFVAQPGTLTELRQGLPQHVSQETHQDMRLDPFQFLVPDRPKL